ncbi:AlpA family phage regulatory protein [Thiothrix sp.]|jgi:prophage regulatory protein|uniref:helix-turn-helix transcriptional regulator n=1 Tax=Thiothrix sp. TaxID=1032 RepID=UPI00257E70CE|nr:AlpA family phage regulatory protein [Thiothrix sp.]
MQNETGANSASTAAPRYITEREVCEIAGVSSNTIAALEKAGKFPKRKRVGFRAIRWLYSEMMEWAANPEGWKPSAA